MKVLRKLTSVYKSRPYVDTFFSYLEYFIFCVYLITIDIIYVKYKNNPHLVFVPEVLVTLIFSHMTKFLKKEHVS